MHTLHVYIFAFLALFGVAVAVPAAFPAKTSYAEIRFFNSFIDLRDLVGTNTEVLSAWAWMFGSIQRGVDFLDGCPHMEKEADEICNKQDMPFDWKDPDLGQLTLVSCALGTPALKIIKPGPKDRARVVDEGIAWLNRQSERGGLLYENDRGSGKFAVLRRGFIQFVEKHANAQDCLDKFESVGKLTIQAFATVRAQFGNNLFRCF